MPSPGRIQLNISVDPTLKQGFKTLCERENVSVASTIQAFLSRCIDADSLPTSDCSLSQLTTHFSDREIETLKTLATNYSEMLNISSNQGGKNYAI